MGRVFKMGRHEGLHPRLLGFLDACASLPFDIVIVRGVTNEEKQAALYAQGRTVPGPNATKTRPLGDVVTNAKTPEETAHGCGGGVDVAPIENGKILWADTSKFRAIGMLAESMNLVWGGRFTRRVKQRDGSYAVRAFFDGGHVETPDWKQLKLEAIPNA